MTSNTTDVEPLYSSAASDVYKTQGLIKFSYKRLTQFPYKGLIKGPHKASKTLIRAFKALIRAFKAPIMAYRPFRALIQLLRV